MRGIIHERKYCNLILQAIIVYYNLPAQCTFRPHQLYWLRKDSFTRFSKERMTTNTIFVGTTPIKVHMPVSFVFAYPLHNLIDREGWRKSMKNTSSGHNGNTENSLMTVHVPITVKRQMGQYALFSVVYNVLQNVLRK